MKYYKHKILYAAVVGRNEKHNHAKIFFKTGLSKAKILRFFDFPNGRRRHLLFLKSPNFLANGVQRIAVWPRTSHAKA